MKPIIDIKIRSLNEGFQTIVFFENNYGASVVWHKFSYGNDEDLFEIAVIKGNMKNWELVYDTPITDDVLGHQTSKDVSRVLEEISNL